MTRRPVVAVMALLLSASPILASDWGSPCEITFSPIAQLSRTVVIGRCTYAFANGTQNNAVTVRGELRVTNSGSSGLDDVCIGQGYCGMSHDIEWPSASTTCTATADFEATQNMAPVSTKRLTASHTTPIPQRPRTDPPPEVINPASPIVVNLHGGYSLSGADDPVLFDLDADGVRSRTGWIARGSDEAFLVLDRNRDGRINDGRELFGDATLLRNGTAASNGFEALRELDDNADGRIDASDRVWADLLLWHDDDHDGVSAASELIAIGSTAVAALHLEYHWTGRRDRHGNELRYQASVDVAPHGVRPVYDIFFIGLP